MGTTRNRYALAVFAFCACVLLLLLAPPAMSQDPPPGNTELSYQQVTVENFKNPNPPPAGLDAEIAVGFGFSHQSQTSYDDVDGNYKAKVTDIGYEATIDETKSSWRDKDSNGDLRKHEQGHLDVAELYARELNASKKNKINELVGVGNTEEEAEADLDQKLEEHFQQIDAEGDRRGDQYETDTDHGKNTDKQNEWNDKIKKLFEGQNKPKGNQAKTGSNKSVYFDAVTKDLTFTNDTVTGIEDENGLPVPGPDPIVGAHVVMPTYFLQGVTVGGSYFFLARDLANCSITLAKDGQTYMSSRVPYMLYYDNMFLGIASDTDFGDVPSDFVAGMQAAYESGDPFVVGTRIFPDPNLAQVTQEFTVSGSSPFEDGHGGVVPEPSSVLALAGGLGALGAMIRRRRRL